MDAFFQTLRGLSNGGAPIGTPIPLIGDFKYYILHNIPYAKIKDDNLQGLVESDEASFNQTTGRKKLQWHFGGEAFPIAKAVRIQYNYKVQYNGIEADDHSSIYIGFQVPENAPPRGLPPMQFQGGPLPVIAMQNNFFARQFATLSRKDIAGLQDNGRLPAIVAQLTSADLAAAPGTNLLEVDPVLLQAKPAGTLQETTDVLRALALRETARQPTTVSETSEDVTDLHQRVLDWAPGDVVIDDFSGGPGLLLAQYDGPAQTNDSVEIFPYSRATLFNDTVRYPQLLHWYFGGKHRQITKAMRLQPLADPNRAVFIGYQGPGPVP